MARSIGAAPDADPVHAVRTYLRTVRTSTVRALTAKAVVPLDPPELRGVTVWPSVR